MNTARTCSRRKIWSKMFFTDVVPAPEDPVMAMIGWRADILSFLPAPERPFAPAYVVRLRP
jgi:hypothetical protein